MVATAPIILFTIVSACPDGSKSSTLFSCAGVVCAAYNKPVFIRAVVAFFVSCKCCCGQVVRHNPVYTSSMPYSLTSIVPFLNVGVAFRQFLHFPPQPRSSFVCLPCSWAIGCVSSLFFFPAAFYVGYSAEDYFIRNVFHMSHLYVLDAAILHLQPMPLPAFCFNCLRIVSFNRSLCWICRAVSADLFTLCNPTCPSSMPFHSTSLTSPISQTFIHTYIIFSLVHLFLFLCFFFSHFPSTPFLLPLHSSHLLSIPSV